MRTCLIRDQGLIDRLDAVVARLRRERPGLRVSREGVVRELLNDALGRAAFRLSVGLAADDDAVPPPTRASDCFTS